MTAALTALRLCFVLLFGTMSLMHGPVMTYGGAHAALPAGHPHATPGEHASADCHETEAPPANHAPCNAFACFTAVEPLPAMARPLSPVLFAVMAAAPMTALDPVRTAPALPPPRSQS